MEVKAEYTCSDKSYTPLWDISIRTLKRCMHETYIDCPYYEQLQYIMDTRLQCVFTYMVSGDDRLARKAIYDFQSSLSPDGIMQSCYPSSVRQVIPGFSLHWVMMIYDHYEYWNDMEMVRHCRPGIDAVLDWFERQVKDDGLVGAMPRCYWSFVDWVPEWKASCGVPAQGQNVPLTLYNLMYADSLKKAAILNEQTGRGDTASEYRTRANRIIAAVKRYCWSDKRQLFQDAPGIEEYSQHVQIWAILSEIVEGINAKNLAVRLIEDTSLFQVSYSFAFFLFRALSAAGVYERSFCLWDRWHHQVSLHLTTWLEDPVSERSDCHAWGSVPLYEFPCEILGVRPLLPGFKRIGIAPQPGSFTWAKGTIVTPYGLIRIAWSRNPANGIFRLTVTGLKGIETEIRLPDGSITACKNKDEVEVVSKIKYPEILRMEETLS